VAAAGGMVEIERLVGALHLVEKAEADLHPMVVELLDVVEVDELAVLALLLVGGRAMHLVVVEVVLLQHLEAVRGQRDFGIEVDVAPFGVHVGHTEETDIVVVANVLGKRAFVLSHVPLADTLGDVAFLLEEHGHGRCAIETARLAVHRRTQNAVMQRVLPRVDGGARGRA